jgi:hypothetical protein
MTPAPQIFDLKVSQIPLLNARSEFRRNLNILRSPEFRGEIAQWNSGYPIHAQYIIWGGPPNMLLTWFLQRAIIGIEAYIPPAVFLAATHYGRLSEDVIKGMRDPFSLRCQSAANTFYNCLPGTVDPDFRMKRARGSVWKSVRRFYEEVRNPLFHGSQLYTEGHNHVETLDAVLNAFELFVEVYNWADWWLPPAFLNMFGTIPISEPPRLSATDAGAGEAI